VVDHRKAVIVSLRTRLRTRGGSSRTWKSIFDFERGIRKSQLRTVGTEIYGHLPPVLRQSGSYLRDADSILIIGRVRQKESSKHGWKVTSLGGKIAGIGNGG